jgi:hypothetical protein
MGDGVVCRWGSIDQTPSARRAAHHQRLVSWFSRRGTKSPGVHHTSPYFTADNTVSSGIRTRCLAREVATSTTSLLSTINTFQRHSGWVLSHSFTPPTPTPTARPRRTPDAPRDDDEREPKETRAAARSRLALGRGAKRRATCVCDPALLIVEVVWLLFFTRFTAARFSRKRFLALPGTRPPQRGDPHTYARRCTRPSARPRRNPPSHILAKGVRYG